MTKNRVQVTTGIAQNIADEFKMICNRNKESISKRLRYLIINDILKEREKHEQSESNLD